MNPIVIDLQPFRTNRGSLRGNDYIIRHDRLEEALTKTNVLNLPGPFEFILGKENDYVAVDDAFIHGYFYELIKKLGYEQAQEAIKFKTYAGYHTIRDINKYIATALRRIAREKKKKEREAIGASWGSPCQLMIPDIGTTIKLSESWKFRLYGERRNHVLMEQLNVPKANNKWYDPFEGIILEIELPSGSTLKVDRIYIRKGGDDYRDLSSITFILKKGADIIYNGNTVNLKKAGRFWAKLSDVNDIVCRVDKITLAQN